MPPATRKTVKLGDACSYVARGISPTYGESGIQIINQRCIRDSIVNLDFCKNLSEEKKYTDVKKIQSFDILINSTGVGTLGRVAQIGKVANDLYCDSHLTIVRIGNENIDKAYMGFYIRGLEHHIESLGKGATGQTELGRDEVKNLDILLPPLPTQQRIAGILSRYDDLIENNTRRIKILEQQAQSLYRQWFVEYKFPGYEDVEMVDSGTEFGEIPEGWEVKTLGNICDLPGGFAFKSSSYSKNGEYGVVTIKNVLDGKFFGQCANYVDVIPDKVKDHQILEKGDILLSLTGNVGRVCRVVGKNYLLNQRVSKITIDKVSYCRSYCLFRSQFLFDKMNMIAKGVAQQNLSPIETKNIDVVIPSIAKRDSFETLCRPILDEMLLLEEKNINLKKQRDILLPKLVSGEILVDDA